MCIFEIDRASVRLTSFGYVPLFDTIMHVCVCVCVCMQHVMGIFGLISASKQDLVSRLKKRKGFILYPGGMAEMFFSCPAVEKLYLSNRKGFIKLAIMHGADIMPTYIFGNTTALRVIDNSILEWISRKLKVSITLMYGRWLLPIPFPVEIMVRRRLVVCAPRLLPLPPHTNLRGSAAL